MNVRLERSRPTRGFVAACAVALSVVACTDDAGCPRVSLPQPTNTQAVLLNPDSPAFTAITPDTFRVRFETSKGDVVIEVVREWAPLGAERFHGLVRNGFFNGNRFFRVIPGFMVQFGVAGIPAIQSAWNQRPIQDDPVVMSNVQGTLTYATAGPDTRTTQMFISYADNPGLDSQGFAPIGRVIQGMAALRLLYGEYGEMAPAGNGPVYGCMLRGGNAYLDDNFAQLDSIVSATIVR